MLGSFFLRPLGWVIQFLVLALTPIFFREAGGPATLVMLATGLIAGAYLKYLSRQTVRVRRA